MVSEEKIYENVKVLTDDGPWSDMTSYVNLDVKQYIKEKNDESGTELFAQSIYKSIHRIVTVYKPVFVCCRNLGKTLLIFLER